jgi:hypothetical protein
MEEMGTAKSSLQQSGSASVTVDIVPADSPVQVMAPSNVNKSEPVDDLGKSAAVNQKEKSSLPKNDIRNSLAGDKASYRKLVSHTLVRLSAGRRNNTAMSQEPAALLAAFKGADKNLTCSHLLDLLQSEPSLFTVSASQRVRLSLNDELHDAAFYDRLCEWHGVPHVSGPADDETFAAHFSSGLLPPPPSRGHCLTTEEQGTTTRLLIADLQFVLQLEEAKDGNKPGPARVFFTFGQQQEGGGGSQRIFVLEVREEDWAEALERKRPQTCFLYFLSTGLRVLPLRYQRMEAVWKERSARLR